MIRKYFKVIALVLVLATISLGTTGCVDEGIDQGHIINKGYEGPSESTSLMYVCYAYGQYGCTSGTYVPFTTHHDEYWWLDLQDCTEHPEIPTTTQNYYDECKHGRVRVSADMYVNADRGTYYPFEERTGDR